MKVVTHEGRFQYNTLLAIAIIKKIYPSVSIFRTKDESVIVNGDIVINLGFVFDPKRSRFDANHYTFNEVFSQDYNYKLSSAGLIFKYHHTEFFKSFGISKDDELYLKLVNKVYNEYILPADCEDNRIDIWHEVKPRKISDMVELYNNLSSDNFNRALDFVSKDLLMFVTKIINNWFYKYKDLEKIIKRTNDYILIADKHYESDLILEIESIYKKNFLYLIFPMFNKFKIHAVNSDARNFKPKLPLKKEWRGKKGRELMYLISGAEYVHINGFVASNKTLAGAIRMCRESYFNK